MIRKIIRINEELCTGCGICAAACHEGAIDIVDGKAKLVREHFCDGLGDCLPECPTEAITFEEREAPEYDAAAVLVSKTEKERAAAASGECPGARYRAIREPDGGVGGGQMGANVSRLAAWPVQLRLASPYSPCFDGAHLLVAADCAAYAYASFHEDFMKGSVTVIGCPKLDGVDYREKLSEIVRMHDIKSVTVARMEVPCCGGIERAARAACATAAKRIPFRVVTISTDGRLI